MKLEPVVAAIRTRCPSFGSRVAGAAQFKLLPENSALAVPCAFVIPLDDSPQESRALNTLRQTLADSFAVVIAISNVADERGQAAAHSVDSMRTELWAALLGWRPDDRYDGINYEGGSLLALDRSRIWYQFEFNALMEIQPSDGWQDIDLATLPHFDGATINVDVIDPIVDPHLATSGPDGRIEQVVKIPKAGTLPT